MLRVNQLKIKFDSTEKQLLTKLASQLGVSKKEIRDVEIIKQSVDARNKGNICMVYTLNVSLTNEKRALGRKGVSLLNEKPYVFPADGRPKGRVVVVGAGPAGLFCALMLRRAGAQVTLLERGRPVEQRSRDVSAFWGGGDLDPSSNVQFGEGGAGTFSDGKLTTGLGDKRLSFIIDEFIAHGAPEDIGYLAKPHIGTDRLRDVVKALRLELTELGAELHFETKLVGLKTKDGRIVSALAQDSRGSLEIEASAIVLATGHSARDTFEMLYESGVELGQKSFAVGVRIEHLQKTISAAQYGNEANNPLLPVPDYKLVHHIENGPSVFSFCVCPGGVVVASASEPGHLVTNGMSEYLRDGENINGGLLVGVGPKDFESGHPLAGIAFQRRLERAAYLLGGENWHAPAQLVGDFLSGKPSSKWGSVRPSYRPGVTMTDLRQCLPEGIAQPLAQAIPILGKKLKGFDDPQAVLTAVESRSSSPVRIVRDENLEGSIKGLYPCGEGAGFAGGIMSAAADGIRCAEQVYKQLSL